MMRPGAFDEDGDARSMLVSRWQGLVPKICTRTCVCRSRYSTHFYGASSQGRRFSDVPKRFKSGHVFKHSVEICQFDCGVPGG